MQDNSSDQKTPLRNQPAQTNNVFSTPQSAPVPMDPPASPPPFAQTPVNGSMDPSIISTKPKRRFPIMPILLVLFLIVLGGGGFLAYQKFVVKKNVQPAATTTVPTKALTTPTQTSAIVWKSYKGQILPIELNIPTNWIVNENENEKLAGQKTITSSSQDLAYSGSDISQGFQLVIGPVNNLTKKYSTFDSFLEAENKDASGTVATISGTTWIKYPTSAKTLMNDTPLTVSLYTSTKQQSMAVTLFDQLLTSFKFVTATPSPTVSGSPMP